MSSMLSMFTKIIIFLLLAIKSIRRTILVIIVRVTRNDDSDNYEVNTMNNRVIVKMFMKILITITTLRTINNGNDY